MSLLNFFWGVGAVLCSLMVAWTAAHKLLPFFLGSVSLFLVLLALAMRGLPFPAAASSRGSAVGFVARAGEESGDLAFRRRVFSSIPGAETAVGGWIGSYVSRSGPRGRMASIMPAFFWAALTLGPRVRNRLSSSCS